MLKRLSGPRHSHGFWVSQSDMIEFSE